MRRYSETFGGEVFVLHERGTSIRVECGSEELPIAVKNLCEEGYVITGCGPGNEGMILTGEKTE